MSPSPLTFMLPCTTSTPLPHLHISTFLNTSTLISSSTWQSDLTLKQAFHLQQSVTVEANVALCLLKAYQVTDSYLILAITIVYNILLLFIY